MYWEVDYIPDGWEVEVAGRFSDQPKAFRFAHLLTLITGHKSFTTAYVSKNGKFVKDMSWISETDTFSMTGSLVVTREWKP